jgi:LCP family protein required for cell wall assembly
MFGKRVYLREVLHINVGILDVPPGVYCLRLNRYTNTDIMDNFKKPPKRTVGSLDGFVQPESKGRRGSGLQSFNQYQSPNNASARMEADDNFRISRVDEFRGAEGFQTSAQAPILRPGADKPAEIGVINEEKPKRSHRWKKADKEPKPRGGFLHRRKEKPLKRHRKFKLFIKSFAVIAVLAGLAVGGLTLKTYFKSRNIFKGGGTGAVALQKNIDPTQLKGEGDGRVNVVLLGIGGEGHDGPDLTDTILIASIDPVAKETALLSVPRDLWVKSPVGGQSKINAVYANAKYAVLDRYSLKKQTDAVKQQAQAAGISAIETSLTSTLGIPIQYYILVDFKAFAQAVDAVGGIDINVLTQLYDPSVAWENYNNPLIAAVGQQHFNGPRALLYARSRHGSARGDFDRTVRQREILTALKTKVLSLGTFANPLKLNQLIDAFGNHVSTDFSLNEMLRVYDIVKDVDSSKIQSIGLADPPNNFVTTDTVNDQSIVRPRLGLFDYTDIQSYIRNTLRDPYLKSENASIVVLNGTATPGLATLKSTLLKSYGYNVSLVADAPTKTYTKTVLVDLTKGVKKFTKNYLEKRLKVDSTTNLPDISITPGTADFVIILGSDDVSAN